MFGLYVGPAKNRSDCEAFYCKILKHSKLVCLYFITIRILLDVQLMNFFGTVFKLYYCDTWKSSGRLDSEEFIAILSSSETSPYSDWLSFLALARFLTDFNRF
jgi:hypothetical protein